MRNFAQRGGLVLAAVSFATQPVAGRAAEIAFSDGYRISSVTLLGRWAVPGPLPLSVGDSYNPARVSEAIELIKSRFASADTDAELLLGKGLVSIAYITSQVTPHPATHTIDVTLLPYAVRLAVDEPGRNFLPLPRSPFATEFAAVPAWLKTFNPQATVSYDRRSGLTPAFRIATASRSAGPGTWFAAAEGERTLAENFHEAEANAGYRRDYFRGLLAQVTQLAGFSDGRRPAGTEVVASTAGWSDTQLALRLPGANRSTRCIVGLRLKGGNNMTASAQSQRELSIGLRALGEKRLGGGNARVALWLEQAQHGRGGAGEYERAAGILGYAREIPLGAHRTVGLGFTAGGGTLHGAAPVTARFAGGPATGSLLYDGLGAASLAEMPGGPVLRNFGRAEAGVPDATGRGNGGRAYWGGSLTLSFPVKAWSRPLLPDEPVMEIDQPDGSTRALTLGDLLQNQVKSGQGIFAGFLQAKGAGASAAAREAAEVFGGIQPAIEWLAQQANLVALKPLLMCDAARIKAAQGSRSESWLGAGGGVQLVIVTAKFEAGYMVTVRGPDFGRRGSFSARLVFENIF